MSDNENLSEEIWRDVPGYEGLYQVSSLGNVKSFYNGERILSPGMNSRGYLTVRLYKLQSHKTHTVHSLVAQAFLPNPSNLPCVNHIDEDKTNNKVENLEWVTYSQNNSWGKRPEVMRQKLIGNTFSKKGAAERKRAVIQFSTEGKYLATFDSACAASLALNGTPVGNQHIIECCQRKRQTAYGYMWKYEDKRGGGMKSVAQVDEGGHIIRRFPSARYAAEVCNIPYGGVAMCCQGHQKTTHGMRFVYLDRNAP